jgi:hypothetical protein
MAAKEIAVKKYVVRSIRGERLLLETLIRKGSNLAWRLLAARILLKADVPEAGEGWSGAPVAAWAIGASTRPIPLAATRPNFAS